MSAWANRVATLKVLLAGSPACSSAQSFQAILNELDVFVDAAMVTDKRRRRLLQVIHSTRALDSSLKAVNSHYSCGSSAHTLKDHLKAFTKHSNANLQLLNQRHYSRFILAIVYPRNKYAHEASAFPSDTAEVDFLVSSISSCLSAVLALE